MQKVKKLNNIKIPKEFNITTKGNNEYIISINDKLFGKKYIKEYENNCDLDEFPEKIVIYCDFDEIKDINFSDSNSLIEFNFIERNYEKTHISNDIKFPFVRLINDIEEYEFWFSLDLEDYKKSDNPIKKCREFYDNVLNTKNFKKNHFIFEGGSILCSFIYQIESMEILNDNYEKPSNIILNEYNKLLDRLNNTNVVEAIFNFPEQYQSILKPYLLYFEEFLNDLCIETDVNIQKVGLDTILSVESKNKDEALDKIADALKAYLCAPIISNGVSMEESFQMKTSLTKLYAQCKNLESQMMYKEISLREQNQQIELKDNIINESKRVLIESGVDTNIITYNNTMLLESLKSMKINSKEIEKKTFLSSIKGSLKFTDYFNGSLELKRKEFNKGK